MSESIHTHLSPSEEELAQLLVDIRPNPSPGFHAHMAAAPWKAGIINSRRRRLALAAAITLIVMLALITFPPTQTVAQQVLRFFLPATTDSITVEIIRAETTFPLSLEAAEESFSSPLFLPTRMPLDLEFRGANFSHTDQVIMLLYSGTNRSLLIVQRKAGYDFQRVGVDAEIQEITVRNTTGEIVTGAWNLFEDDHVRYTTATPGSVVTLGAFWNPDAPLTTLRWEENGISYKITASGAFTLDEIIAIAESLSPTQ